MNTADAELREASRRSASPSPRRRHCQAVQAATNLAVDRARLVNAPSATRLPVRWRDLDPLGHVNAVVFLTYLEEGRNAWLAAILGPGFGPEQYVVARVELDFRAEIPAGTAYVQSQHAVTAVGRSSITFDERLSIADDVTVAKGRVVLVMWDRDHHRSRPLSREENDALTATGAAL